MTIKIEVECDASGCCNSIDILGDTDADVEYAGYFQDPRYEYHYCASCWPEIKSELEVED